MACLYQFKGPVRPPIFMILPWVSSSVGVSHGASSVVFFSANQASIPPGSQRLAIQILGSAGNIRDAELMDYLDKVSWVSFPNFNDDWGGACDCTYIGILQDLRSQCGPQYGNILYYHDNMVQYKEFYIVIIQYAHFRYSQY